jgi:Bacterial PH domain
MTNQPYYDNKSQFERISAYCIPGETIYAVFDCKGGGTGFVGITDQRVMFYDQGVFLKKKSMISIPYNQVIGLASVDEGLIFQTSEITMITAAGKFNFEFRGGDKAHKAYAYIMGQIMGQANPQLVG